MQGAPSTVKRQKGSKIGGDKALNLVLSPLGKQKNTGGKAFRQMKEFWMIPTKSLEKNGPWSKEACWGGLAGLKYRPFL